jgi:hypothetical protein
MQRIGMISSVGAVEDFYNTAYDADPSPLVGLQTSMYEYGMGSGNLQEIERAVSKLNAFFSAYVLKKDPNGKQSRTPFYKELQHLSDKVNETTAALLRADKVPGPYGRLHAVGGRLFFRKSGEVADKVAYSVKQGTAKAASSVKQGTAKAVTSVREKFKKKDAAAAGFGTEAGPLLYSLVGAGVGYAVARKNRGVATGIGALVGFLINRYVTTPATPGTGYVGAVADAVTEFSTILAENGYPVSEPRESTVIVDNNRFDGSAVTVTHAPDKATMINNLALAKALKYGINTKARGALQVEPTDGGSVVIFADV